MADHTGFSPGPSQESVGTHATGNTSSSGPTNPLLPPSKVQRMVHELESRSSRSAVPARVSGDRARASDMISVHSSTGAEDHVSVASSSQKSLVRLAAILEKKKEIARLELEALEVDEQLAQAGDRDSSARRGERAATHRRDDTTPFTEPNLVRHQTALGASAAREQGILAAAAPVTGPMALAGDGHARRATTLPRVHEQPDDDARQNPATTIYAKVDVQQNMYASTTAGISEEMMRTLLAEQQARNDAEQQVLTAQNIDRIQQQAEAQVQYQQATAEQRLQYISKVAAEHVHALHAGYQGELDTLRARQAQLEHIAFERANQMAHLQQQLEEQRNAARVELDMIQNEAAAQRAKAFSDGLHVGRSSIDGVSTSSLHVPANVPLFTLRSPDDSLSAVSAHSGRSVIPQDCPTVVDRKSVV